MIILRDLQAITSKYTCEQEDKEYRNRLKARS